MLSLAAQRTYIVFNELFLREYVCVCFGVLFIVVCRWCVPDDQARVVWQVLITLVSGHKSVSNDWSGVRVICDNVVFRVCSLVFVNFVLLEFSILSVLLASVAIIVSILSIATSVVYWCVVVAVVLFACYSIRCELEYKFVSSLLECSGCSSLRFVLLIA